MRPVLRTLALALAASLWWSLAPAAAQNVKETTSLQFVPADASFYNTSLRRKELLDRVAASKAYHRMVEHRVLATAIAQASASYDAALNMLKRENPESWAALRGFYEQGLALLGDMVSREYFCYGGPSWVDASPRLQTLSSRINALVREIGASDDAEGAELFMKVIDDPEVQKLLSGLRTPEVVVGFKISNRQVADDQLTVLTFAVRQAISSNPDLAFLRSIYKKETLAGGPFHVFSLDFSLFTPEIIQKIKEDDETAAEIITKLKSTLKDLKLVIALGRIDDYLIVSISNDLDRLANWGKGPLLYDVAELAPLRKASDKRFTDISYVSKALAAAASNPEAIKGQLEQLRQIRTQFEEAALTDGIPLKEESLQKVVDLYLEDIEKIQKFAQENVDPAADVSFTYDVASGFESMRYHYRVDPYLDGSKPLSILHHVGAAPILYVASRLKTNGDAGAIVDYIAKRIVTLLDAVEFDTEDEEGKEAQKVYDKIVEKARPLAEEFSKITREQIFPALKDGQFAFVIDASLKTNQLSDLLPAAEEPVRLPEIAFLIGVSDDAKLRDGLKAYLALGRKAVEAIREIAPDAVPEGATIPDPELTSEEGGDLATYEIPGASDTVNRFVLPTLGLGDNVAVLALHRTTAARLLKGAKPEKAAEELRSSLDKPLAAASQFDFHEVVNVLESYVSFLVDLGAFENLAAQSPFSAEELQEQTVLILDFLRCYQRSTTVCYIEDGVTISRTVNVYVDYEVGK